MTRLSLLGLHNMPLVLSTAILKAQDSGILISISEEPEVNRELKPLSITILSDNHMDYFDIESDDKLPMSQRSHGWYNKFSKNNVFKRK